LFVLPPRGGNRIDLGAVLRSGLVHFDDRSYALVIRLPAVQDGVTSNVIGFGRIAVIQRRWLTLIALTLFAAVPAPARGPAAAPARAVVVENGLVYGKGGGKELQLDLARPQG